MNSSQLEMRAESFEGDWADFGPRFGSHDFENFVEAKLAWTIWAIGREGIENVGHAQDSGFGGEFAGCQPQTIAAAVELLMVCGGHIGKPAKAWDHAQDATGVVDVLPHRHELLGCQLSWFVENQIRDSELANVVQQSP